MESRGNLQDVPLRQKGISSILLLPLLWKEKKVPKLLPTLAQKLIHKYILKSLFIVWCGKWWADWSVFGSSCLEVCLQPKPQKPIPDHRCFLWDSPLKSYDSPVTVFPIRHVEEAVLQLFSFRRYCNCLDYSKCSYNWC